MKRNALLEFVSNKKSDNTAKETNVVVGNLKKRLGEDPRGEEWLIQAIPLFELDTFIG